MAEPAATVSQLSAALRYAALGWQVIPLHTPERGGCSCGNNASDHSAGKHPRFGDWVKRATTDADAIKGWWRTWPAANVGLVTGARSGFFVLDIDPDHGGEVSLATLLAEHGALPITVEALTGSGGRHILFRYPGQHVPNSTSKLGAGLDVRGDGGQIVAAPSLHRSGGTYEWQQDCGPGTPLADAPAWLLALLLEQPKPATVAAPVPRSQPIDQARRRASAYLARIPGATSGEGGHGQTWKAALAIVRGFRLSEGEAFDLLWSEYNPRCSPAWSEREVRHKITEALNNAAVPFGYLLDVERTSTPPQSARVAAPLTQSREPGSDDGDESAAAAPASTVLGLRPVADLLSEVLPPIDWLVAPYLEAGGSMAALVAPPNLGKTLLAMWLCTQVAAAGRRVAVIELEGGKRGLQKRLSRAIEACGGVEKCGSIDYAFKPRISLMKTADIERMCVELQGYSMILIDSLACATAGLEENEAVAMGLVVAALTRIAEATGATILLIHHTGKTKWKPGGDPPSVGDGRGSGVLDAALDTVLALAPLADSEQVEGSVSFGLYVTKQRDEERAKPQLVRVLMTGAQAVVTMDPLKEAKETQAVSSMSLDVLSAVRRAGEDGCTKQFV
jgi:hypothetical protein